MRLKLKKNSSVHKDGLYVLEDIMGQSDGHGWGFGGEDIEWYINYRKSAKSYKTLRVAVDEKNDWIEITFKIIHDNWWKEDLKGKDDEILGIEGLPLKWFDKIQKVIAEHFVCRKKLVCIKR